MSASSNMGDRARNRATPIYDPRNRGAIHTRERPAENAMNGEYAPRSRRSDDRGDGAEMNAEGYDYANDDSNRSQPRNGNAYRRERSPGPNYYTNTGPRSFAFHERRSYPGARDPSSRQNVNTDGVLPGEGRTRTFRGSIGSRGVGFGGINYPRDVFAEVMKADGAGSGADQDDVFTTYGGGRQGRPSNFRGGMLRGQRETDQEQYARLNLSFIGRCASPYEEDDLGRSNANPRRSSPDDRHNHQTDRGRGTSSSRSKSRENWDYEGTGGRDWYSDVGPDPWPPGQRFDSDRVHGHSPFDGEDASRPASREGRVSEEETYRYGDDRHDFVRDFVSNLPSRPERHTYHRERVSDRRQEYHPGSQFPHRNTYPAPRHTPWDAQPGSQYPLGDPFPGPHYHPPPDPPRSGVYRNERSPDHRDGSAYPGPHQHPHDAYHSPPYPPDPESNTDRRERAAQPQHVRPNPYLLPQPENNAHGHGRAPNAYSGGPHRPPTPMPQHQDINFARGGQDDVG